MYTMQPFVVPEKRLLLFIAIVGENIVAMSGISQRDL